MLDVKRKTCKSLRKHPVKSANFAKSPPASGNGTRKLFVGPRVRRLREQLEWNQSQLAARLGLSLSYGIIREQGGMMTAANVARGARFDIYVPVVSGTSSIAARAASICAGSNSFST